MPTKTARRDYNELLPGSVMSRTQINTAPGNTQRRGEAMLRCFREEEEKTRGTLSSSDFNGFKFQNQCSKAAVLNPVPRVPCSTHALHLSLSHSDQLQQTVPIIHFSHSNEKRYTWTRVR